MKWKQQQGSDSLLKHTHLSHSHGMILSGGCADSPRTCWVTCTYSCTIFTWI